MSDEVEVEEAVRTDGSDAATKPMSKRGPTIKAGLSNKFTDNKSKGPKDQVARKRTGGRKPVLKPDSDIEEISVSAEKENERGAEATRKRKGKAKATEPEVIDDVDVHDVPVDKKGKRKRKATSDEESVEIIGVSKAKRGARAKGPAGVGRGRSRPPSSRARSRQASVMPVVDDDVGRLGRNSEEAPPAPKQRKLTLFPTVDKGAASILAGVRLSSTYHLIGASNFCCLLVWNQRSGDPYLFVAGQTK